MSSYIRAVRGEQEQTETTLADCYYVCSADHGTLDVSEKLEDVYAEIKTYLLLSMNICKLHWARKIYTNEERQCKWVCTCQENNGEQHS